MGECRDQVMSLARLGETDRGEEIVDVTRPVVVRGCRSGGEESRERLEDALCLSNGLFCLAGNWCRVFWPWRISHWHLIQHSHSHLNSLT